MKRIFCYFFGCVWDKIAEYEDFTSEWECKRCKKREYWEEINYKTYKKLS